MQAVPGPCPVVGAIRDAATNDNLDPLLAFLRDQPARWHVTPVQAPLEFDNCLPLHVAVHMNCLRAVDLLLVGAPVGVFSFENGSNRTPLQLARHLLQIDETTIGSIQTQALQPNVQQRPLPDVVSRQCIVMRLSVFLIYAHIDIDDSITLAMRAILDDAGTRPVIHEQLQHAGHNTLLHVAILKRRPMVVKWLLEHGAAPHLANAQGQNCLALAQDLDNPVINGVETEIHRMLLYCIQHPDVFISYRQSSEMSIAKSIFKQLTGPPHYFRVFWDQTVVDNAPNIYGIPSGKVWDLHFAKILTQSTVFAPILSYDGVVKRMIQNTHSQTRDNVLVEYIINHACYDEEHKATVPLCIGPPGLAYPWDHFSFTFPPPVGNIAPDDPSNITT